LQQATIAFWRSFVTWSVVSWNSARPQQCSPASQRVSIRENTLPTISYLADRLRIKHHSAVELVDRLVEAELITRKHDASDRRRVSLELTASAERHLEALSASHMMELKRMQPALLEILNRAEEVEHEAG
jgi:DNA-binding MarR family transcriptional regulator